ncbi:MAG TPA: molybdopterin converting factor subunit 1 [Kofleriaceae bacterium]|jgi:molybdopterin synthase catalytic subunit
MRVQVLYFAVFREKLGTDAEPLDLPAGASVADALAALASRHELVARLRGRFRVAVNESFADDAHLLADNDELALIPPVAGGARHVALLDEPLSLDRCIARVSAPGMGAVITFTGIVRRDNRGTLVARLEYSAYAGMAVREMTRLCDEIESEIPGCALAVEHRIGSLLVGDLAVVIAAAAPHRAEAFTACRAMIDRLKDRVPIWKKEFSDQGDVWIGLGP